MTAGAISSATRTQQQALQSVQQRIQSGMDPQQLQQIATQGDIQRANQQQQLLAQLYPGLAAAQKTASDSLATQAGGFGAQSLASQVGATAAKEAQSAPSTAPGQQQLIDSALAQLKAGATLPPDVEAQLVQSGLEASGMTTQRASAQGVGGQQLRTILGTAGIQLQQQRQQQAASLLTQAQGLETQRQQVLQSLFPNLSQVQLQQAGGAQSIFGTAASATPQAGLSGSSLASAWLQRIGALNQNQLQTAGVTAQGTLAGAQNWANVIGQVSGSGAGGGGGNGSGSLLSGIMGGGNSGKVATDVNTGQQLGPVGGGLFG
jgi:hypothetical protein